MNRVLGLVLVLAIAGGGVLWILVEPESAAAGAEPVGSAPGPAGGGGDRLSDVDEPGEAPDVDPGPSGRVAHEAEEVFHERMTLRYADHDLEGLRGALTVLNFEMNTALMAHCQPKVAAGEGQVDDGTVYPVDVLHYRGPDATGAMRVVVPGDDEPPDVRAKHREVGWLSREIERRAGDQ